MASKKKHPRALDLFAEAEGSHAEPSPERATPRAKPKPRSGHWYESPLLPETRAALAEHRPQIVRPEQLPDETIARLAELPPEARSVEWSAILSGREMARRLGYEHAQADEEREREQLDRTRRPGARRVRSERHADGVRFGR